MVRRSWNVAAAFLVLVIFLASLYQFQSASPSFPIQNDEKLGPGSKIEEQGQTEEGQDEPVRIPPVLASNAPSTLPTVTSRQSLPTETTVISTSPTDDAAKPETLEEDAIAIITPSPAFSTEATLVTTIPSTEDTSTITTADSTRSTLVRTMPSTEDDGPTSMTDTYTGSAKTTTPMIPSAAAEQSTTTIGAESATISASPMPEPSELSRTVVMGRLQTEDTDWVASSLTDWQNAIYYVDLPDNVTSPSGLRTPMNKAREAMPYLTYLTDHYPNFTDVVAFIHPHRNNMPSAWHNDARDHDAVNMLHDLNLDTVMERGYVNLRCNNEVGCPDEIHPFRNPPLPEKLAEHAYPYVYAHFFNATFGEMREQIPVVATQCCAQFAVSKERILRLPKDEYVRYRRYLEETHYSDQTVGTVLEYMWHIIFGAPAVQCEDVITCWCLVYGRCSPFGR